MDTIASVKNLSFSYSSDRPILQNLSIDFRQNECVSIIGSNGCGKTTLSFCLSGIIPNIIHGHQEGAVVLGNTNMKDLSVSNKASRLGYLFEDPDNQFITLRVKDEIEFGLRNLSYSPDRIEDISDDAVRRFNLNALLEQSPHDLSMGQKQRVVLASLIALSPKLMILDEPGSTLDIVNQRKLVNCIKALRADGITFIVFSHNLRFVQQISDRVIGLKAGSVVFDKSIDEFTSQDYESLYDLTEEAVAKCPTDRQHHGGSLLEFKGVTYRYPRKDIDALHKLSFAVKRNEVLGIVGMNGSGKSTLLLAAAGLLKTSSGNIEIDNNKLSKLNPKERISSLGIVFQNPNHQIFSSTIYDELSFGLRNIGIAEPDINNRIEKVRDLFELGNLENDPHSLSYGWRKILSMACVVAMEPDILLLDEPELGLDLYFQRKVDRLVRQLKELGRTVIIATHDTELVARVCDRVVWIDKGEILRSGHVDVVLSDMIRHYETKR